MLDTRHKILTAEQAVASLRGCVVFAAYFDVLSVPLIRRLNEMKGPVVALVLDPPQPVLSARIRSELAAALRCVEAVVPIAGDPAEFLDALEPVQTVHWEREDAQRTADLIEHVQSRQNA